MNGHHRSLAVTVLLSGAFAPAQATTASTPLLRIVANEARWMAAFAQPLGLVLPALDADKQFEVVLPMSGTATFATAVDRLPAHTLVVDVRGAAWLQQEAQAVATVERQLATRAEGFAKLVGLPGNAARELCTEVFALARSLEAAHVVVTQVDAGRHYDIHLELVPLADSPFARWLDTVVPAKEASPHLPWPDAVLRLELAVDRDTFPAVCAPFVPFVTAFGIQRRDPTTAEADLRALLPLLDGSFHLALQAGRLGLVYGLRDGASFAARATDPERLRQDTDDLASQRIEAEFTPAACTHRGVPLLRSRVHGRQPLPGLANADGDLVSFGGRVGDLWLQIGGGEDSRESMQGAIDNALDGKLRGPSAASPANAEAAWLTCGVDLVRLAAMLASTPSAASIPADAPGRLHLSLSSSPHSLNALLQLR